MHLSSIVLANLSRRVANAALTTIGTATYGSQNYNLIYEGELGGSGLVWLDYTNDFDAVTGQERWRLG